MACQVSSPRHRRSRSIRIRRAFLRPEPWRRMTRRPTPANRPRARRRSNDSSGWQTLDPSQAGATHARRPSTGRNSSRIPPSAGLDNPRGTSHDRPMGEPVDAWFVREVLAHEQALMRFLHRNWRDHDEVGDLRQEIYVRVYEAAMRQPPDSPKSFLFATARNLLADRVRRQRIVSITAVGDLEQLNVLQDELDPPRWLGGREALTRLARALDRLPERCREVVWLRRVEDLPQKEIARRLGISEKTVEKHIAKGSRMMADFFHGRTEAGAPPSHARSGQARIRRPT